MILTAVNLLTATWWPVPWTDEALFLDPAANFFFHHQFTSSLWHTQPYGEFWISNAPLYSFFLAAWLKIFGFGVLAARSLNLFLHGVWLWICLDWAIQRWRFRPIQCLVLALLLTLPNSLAFMARNGRYDMLACLVSTFLAIGLVEGRRTKTVSAAVGFLMPWVSLPTLVFTLSTIGWLAPRSSRWGHALLHMLGGLCGFTALAVFAGEKIGFLHFIGILQNLYLSVPSGSLPERLASTWINISGFAADRFWILAAPALAFFSRCRGLGNLPGMRDGRLLRWIWAGACSGLVFALVYKMNILYLWTITVPLAFLFSSSWLGFCDGAKGGVAIFGLGVVLMITGLPGRLVLGFGQRNTWHDNSARIRETVGSRGKETKPVICYTEWPFYYDVKDKNTLVLGPDFVVGAQRAGPVPEIYFLSPGSRLPDLSRDLRRIDRGRADIPPQAGRENLLARLAGSGINRMPEVEIWALAKP